MKTFLIFVLSLLVITAMIAGACIMSGCTKDKDNTNEPGTDTTVEPEEPTPEEDANGEDIDTTDEPEEPTPVVIDDDDAGEEGGDA